MPLFDFHCENCGYDFEELVAQNSTPKINCPKCDSTQVVRKMSLPSPLKTGAFPFKPGPVRPLSYGGAPSCGSCASCSTNSKASNS